MSLPLFDPLKPSFHRRRSTANGVPRISSPGFGATLSPVKLRVPPAPDDPLDATRLTLRLEALATALDDLPGQARRLARWQANRARSRDAAGAQERKNESVAALHATPSRRRRFSPLRLGWPPGWSRRPGHEVHALLADLHGLALDALADTS